MKLTFREKILSNEKFKNAFDNLVKEEKIIEIPKELWDIIEKDKTLKEVEENKILTLSDLLKEGYSEGRCYQCTTTLALLFHLHGFNVYQVVGKNEYFKGTKGSPNGGHYYLEILYDGCWYILDTSLLCMIKKYNTRILGYEDIKSINAKDMLLDKDYFDIYDTLKRKLRR